MAGGYVYRRTCRVCRVKKILTKFTKNSGCERGRTRTCKACVQKRAQAFKARTPVFYATVKRHEAHKRKYGITPGAYDALLEEQGGVCRICHMPESAKPKKGQVIPSRLGVDHCHDSGKVRGLLCRTCNSGLGYFKDRVDLLLEAVEYLKEYGDK